MDHEATDMNCEDAEPLLPQLVFDELDADVQADLMAHVDSCASCRRTLGDLRVTVHVLRDGLEAGPAPVLSDARKDALFAALEADVDAPESRRWHRPERRHRHPRTR